MKTSTPRALPLITTSSTCISLLNRLSTLPVGVVSKKAIGEAITELSVFTCRTRETRRKAK